MSTRLRAGETATQTPERADVRVFPTSDALTTGAAECLVASAAAAVRARGRFVVALSGGVTPKALYERLASAAYAALVDWSSTEIFWGDERCVPPDDAASNARMAREALLDRVPIPSAHVHRIRGEESPTESAALYEQELRATFATPVGLPDAERDGRFDVVLLGLGDDGHTASLFPDSAALKETTRWVVADWMPAVSMWRVTLTPIVINAAAEILFLVSGREKAAILQRVLEGPRQPERLPAQRIAPSRGRLRWLVDAAAASMLEPKRVAQ